MDNQIISVKSLNKNFGGIRAISDIDLDFRCGEIHALMGENGAGKSTLCKILSGAYTPDSGTIVINGKEFGELTPRMAKDEGIGMIYQEFNLVNEMTVYENIFLGKEIRKGMLIDRKAMIAQTRELFRRMNITLDPMTKIKDLSIAYCQLVEIAKTLQEKVRVIIFDEPTAPLTADEISVLFGIIRKLKEDGLAVIYISHRMDEIMGLTDRVTVMRDGKIVKTLQTDQTDIQEIIRLMIGRTIDETFPARRLSSEIDRSGVPALEVRGLTNSKVKDVSFRLYRGEILALSGLVGSGRTEILRALFGADPISKGEILVNGEKVDFKNKPSKAIRAGISLLPEDRKRQGLHLFMSIRNNLSLAKIRELSKLLFIDLREERQQADRYIHTLSIKIASLKNPVSSLSGGNQQKVVVSKWLMTDGDILLFDEPTRGIDVGAKKEIYELLDRLRREGKAIIMVSSEMPEVIGMCDRTIVMYEGAHRAVLFQSQPSGQTS